MKKWTNEACAEILKRHKEGERICDIERRLSISTTRVRALLQKAERQNSRQATELDGLSARIRNALLACEIKTVKEVRAAFTTGAIDEIPNIGKLTKIEILKWLCGLTPN